MLIIIHKEYIFDLNHQMQSLMKQFLYENHHLRKRLTKTKERIVETIYLFNATILQQINKENKNEKNEKIISVDEKSTKNVKIKK